MKNLLKTGLLTLTIVFGITSCDKNAGFEEPTVQEKLAAGVVHSISFGENLDTEGEAGKSKDESSKTHSEFTHRYGAVNSQSLVISDSNGAEVWSGFYTPNNISLGLFDGNGDASEIILADGDYTAATSYTGTVTADVLGLLPYSSAASFTVPPPGTITLISSLERGFLIVNANGVEVTGVSVGEGLSLISDDSDELNDYFGYLNAGSFPVSISIDNANDQSATQEIALGFAYTINLGGLSGVETSGTAQVSGTFIEGSPDETAGLFDRDSVGDQNNDSDTLDNGTFVEHFTTVLIDGVEQSRVSTGTVYTVVNDISAPTSGTASATGTFTEGADVASAFDKADAGDQNGDTDDHDNGTFVEYFTTVLVNGVEDEAQRVSTRIDYTVTNNFTEINGNIVEDAPIDPADPAADATPFDTYEWGLVIDEDRFQWTITSVSDSDVDNSVATELPDASLLPEGKQFAASGITSTSTTIDGVTLSVYSVAIEDIPAVIDPADEYISSAADAVISGGVTSTIDDGAAVITYHIGDVEYASLELAQAAVAAGQTATIITRSTQNTLDQVTAQISTVVTSFSIQINGVEDVPALDPRDDESDATEIAAASSVPGTPVVSDVTSEYTAAAAPAAEWVEINGVYSNTDFPAATFTIDLDPLFSTYGYILSTNLDAIVGEYSNEADAIAAGKAAVEAL